jgi:3-oxoacyl-[acyl-carrier-protein] synthase II
MSRVAVSGIGIVSPGGLGREAFLQALAAGGRAAGGSRVPEFSLEQYLGGSHSFRRVAGATKYALAAMSLAIRDAGFSVGAFGGERAGIVATITHGAVTYSVDFHRVLLLEGPLAASPLHFSESVPNAPAGNGAIAFQVRGPVHTLMGEEPVGTQAIDLAAGLIRAGLADRLLVVGTEEWNELVAHAYGQCDSAARRLPDPGEVPPLSEGAAALVLEPEDAVLRRGARPHAVLLGWSLDRSLAARLEVAAAEAIRDACRASGRSVAEVDHVLPSTGRHRHAATRGFLVARGEGAGPLTWVDLVPMVGNPAGASNLLQVAASASLMSAGRVAGPGLVLSTGISGTLSAVVLSRADVAGA